MKLVVMGGTFNPPHIAHLICAEEVYELFKF
ncbi:TPA: nicotinate-nucleotide adenylyltransferase, partial [Candidatus Poribacteria bacterium]|nr:nicotinate-nucleotide adenylyltransferase [Candidatus Poribacteria bacterium]